MNYWVTTQWPPRVGYSDDIKDFGLWLEDKKEAVADELTAGDIVFIYQSKTGKTAEFKNTDGSPSKVPCKRGKGGVIAVCEALSGIYETDEELVKYTDGTKKWWRWYAPLKLLTRSGFVDRHTLNGVLGYKLNNKLRAFGDNRSGVKNIKKNVYDELFKLFKGQLKFPPVGNEPGNGKKKYGSGGESKEHLHLKLYTASNANRVLGEEGIDNVQIEYSFQTGDRADVLFTDQYGRVIGVEIEVNISDDEHDGPLQAIKYRYMAEYTTGRERGDSRSVLVAYTISNKIKEMCARYDIQCVEVDKQVVDKWAVSEEGRRVIEENKR